VVVHLLGRREAELERGELERSLAQPGRDVDGAHSAGAQHPVELADGLLRLPEVLDHGHAEHDVQGAVGHLFQGLRKEPLDGPDLGMRSQVGGQGDVQQSGGADAVEHPPHEGGVVAAADVGDVLARERSDDPLDLALGQPHAEPVDGCHRAALAEGVGAPDRVVSHGRAPRRS